MIVSHSPKVAEGAADMVRQMVGDSVPLAWTGGNPAADSAPTSAAIMAAIDRAWSDAGVAVLVDLGGAETNSEMAIEMLPERRGKRVVVCNAPVVEGAVMAATEASGGSTLDAVKRTAEELMSATMTTRSTKEPNRKTRRPCHGQRAAHATRSGCMRALGEADQARQELCREHRGRACRRRAVGRCQEPGEGHARQGGQGRNAAFPRQRRGRGRGGRAAGRRWSSATSTKSEAWRSSELTGRAGIARAFALARLFVLSCACAAQSASRRSPSRSGAGADVAIAARSR